MRIIAGHYRGTQLASPGAGDPAAHLRPTSDKVRGAIFNLLAHGDYRPIAGARVLDLFAGSGALGFEALSRGAAHLTLVDDGNAAQALIRKNAATLRREITLLPRDATRLGPNPGAAYDLIFLDPPYGKAMGEKALSAAIAGSWLAAGAVIVWEEGVPQVGWPTGSRARDSRSYGQTWVHLGEFAPH